MGTDRCAKAICPVTVITSLMMISVLSGSGAHAVERKLAHELIADLELAQHRKLIAGDGAAYDWFGTAVAISGDTLVVGAPFDDPTGDKSGSAYVFERDYGGPGQWGQVAKLEASDAEAWDEFGGAVAISGDTVVVGASKSDDAGDRTGSAYVFDRDRGPDKWGESKILSASDAAMYDEFGASVAVSGDTVLVGAFANEPGGGSAYVFERNLGGPDEWGERAKLTASDGAAFDYFGTSVAISGDIVVVGNPQDDDAGSSSGSAYVFERDHGGPDDWGQRKKLIADDAAAGDNFGETVAISGETVVVGAWADDDDGAFSGSAYVFERNLGGANEWGKRTKLTATDAAAGDQFGESVAIFEDTIVVGALNDSDAGFQAGSAYVFARDLGGANNWGQTRELIAHDAWTSDQFGASVAISADTVLVGAAGGDDAGTDSGAAYVFGPPSMGIFIASGPVGPKVRRVGAS